MIRPTVVHATTVVARHFANVAPGVVFAAWEDPTQRVHWDLPGNDWVLAQLEMDFRVGGRELTRFGPRDDPRYWSAGEYLDIVPNERIVTAETMYSDSARISSTLCTIEFAREANGTRLVLTDQSAFYDGAESPDDRRAGWGEILDRLVLFIEKRGSQH